MSDAEGSKKPKPGQRFQAEIGWCINFRDPEIYSRIYWNLWQSEGGDITVGSICALHALREISAAVEAVSPDPLPPAQSPTVQIPWWVAKILANRWAEFCKLGTSVKLGKILGTEASGRGRQAAFKRVDRIRENFDIATEVVHQKEMSDVPLSNEDAIAEVAELFGLGEDRVHKAFYDHREFVEEVYRRNAPKS